MGTSLDCVLHLALSFFHRGAGISGKAKHRIGSNLVILALRRHVCAGQYPDSFGHART
jgi:hypothetical protein